MLSILCEGKYDVCFFDQVSIEKSIKTHIARDINKYLELASPMCSYYLKIDKPLIILGDNGKFDACNKYLSRIIKNKLGKYEEDIFIFYVIDSDYSPDFILINNVFETLESLRSENAFMNKIVIEKYNNEFILKHPVAPHKIVVRVFTVPESLEKKAMEYYCNKFRIRDREQSPHDLIDNVARKHYQNDREKMFREMAENNVTDEWIEKIFEDIQSLF